MKTIRKTKQSEKVKEGDPCSDCGVLIAGGFKFTERTRDGWRCFECLMVEMEKTRGFSGIEQISEELRNIPSLEGRKWKAYALELKKQRSIIAHITAATKAQDEQWKTGEIV